MPQILAVALLAARQGLRLPLVYNTGGCDSLETLALLDGDLIRELREVCAIRLNRPKSKRWAHDPLRWKRCYYALSP